jgi:clan AA aspartic protease (TIGR02281 family)
MCFTGRSDPYCRLPQRRGCDRERRRQRDAHAGRSRALRDRRRGRRSGRPVLVDTGATFVELPRSQATRIGLDYRNGKPTMLSTANGVARGWIVTLDSVRVGSVTVRDVQAVVSDQDMPAVLLGMSVLGRFDMQQRGSMLMLHRRAR